MERARLHVHRLGVASWSCLLH